MCETAHGAIHQMICYAWVVAWVVPWDIPVVLCRLIGQLIGYPTVRTPHHKICHGTAYRQPMEILAVVYGTTRG